MFTTENYYINCGRVTQYSRIWYLHEEIAEFRNLLIFKEKKTVVHDGKVYTIDEKKRPFKFRFRAVELQKYFY